MAEQFYHSNIYTIPTVLTSNIGHICTKFNPCHEKEGICVKDEDCQGTLCKKSFNSQKNPAKPNSMKNYAYWMSTFEI